MTFAQKLLGTNYKWFFVLRQGFLSNTTYRLNSFAFLLGSVILVLGTLTVWFVNKDIDFREIFTYIVVGEAVIFPCAIQYHIGEAIQDGKFSSRLMMPSSYLKYYAFYSFGQQLFENLSRFGIYCVLTIIFREFLIISPNFLIFGLFVIVAYLINTFVGIIVGSSAFFLLHFLAQHLFLKALLLFLEANFCPLTN